MSHFEVTRAVHSRASGAHSKLNARRPIDRRASGWVSNDISDDRSERTGVYELIRELR